MRHSHDEARHHAEATLARVNNELRNPRIANDARKSAMLTNMKEAAMRTIEHHNRMYGDRQDHYNNDNYRGENRNDNRNNRYNDRRNDYRSDDDRRMDTMDMVSDALNVVNRILPHITGTDDMDVEDAVRVRGYTRRGRGGRRVRVPGYTRRDPVYRADADSWGDDYNDDRYADDDYSYDVENARRGKGRRRDRYGRFADMDDRTMDDVARTAATAAADTARRMMDDHRSDVYPHYPLMPRHDADNRQDRTDRTSDTGAVGPGRR